MCCNPLVYRLSVLQSGGPGDEAVCGPEIRSPPPQTWPLSPGPLLHRGGPAGLPLPSPPFPPHLATRFRQVLTERERETERGNG